METRISAKGQITLPAEVRRRLKVKTGDVLAVNEVRENSVVQEVKRKEPPAWKKGQEDVLKATAGLWRKRTDLDDNYLRDLREADRRRLEELLGE